MAVPSDQMSEEARRPERRVGDGMRLLRQLAPVASADPVIVIARAGHPYAGFRAAVSLSCQEGEYECGGLVVGELVDDGRLGGEARCVGCARGLQ